MTSVVQQRWATRKLVGDKQHAQIVRVRPGHMRREYLDTSRIDNNSPIYPPLIWKGHNHHCWQGLWSPDGPWMTLPSVQSTKWSRSVDLQTGGQQGTSTLTVIMDNVAFPEQEGVGGLYHTIARGYYSPLRGTTPRGRGRAWPKDAPNVWRNVLDGGYQIELWEGYGTGADIVLRDTPDPVHGYAPTSGALDRTWTGIVVDCEIESFPDQITLTAQDFGIFLTDERVMGRNKALECRSPINFADRLTVQGQKTIKGPYHVSSGGITGDGAWTGSDSGTQWITVDLPAGYYEDFYIAPAKSGQKVYVSLYQGSQDGSLDRTHAIPRNNWTDLNDLGLDVTTPSAGRIDGIPYMFSIPRLAQSPSRRWYLGHGFDIRGKGGKLRLTFEGGGDVNHFYAYRFGSDPASYPKHAKGWILVDDASDVVRMTFIWAGFKEWTVEALNWSLYKPMSYGEDKFFIDIINEMMAQGNFIFHMGPPTNNDESIGVPHFEHMHAVDAQAGRPVLGVKDTDMVEALDVKTDLSDLPLFMRYRGIIVKKGGITAGQDLSQRVEAVYWPPWSGRWSNLGNVGGIGHLLVERVAGIGRAFTETMGNSLPVALTTVEECSFACVLAAIQYALSMRTGQFQIPGLSRLKLNDTISVMEESTATNSRLWVTSIESEHVNGGADTQGHWTMTIAGSMIDNPDMDALIADYNAIWEKAQGNRGGWSG